MRIKQKTCNMKIQLAFPKSRENYLYLPKDLSGYSGEDFFHLFCAEIGEVEGWFNNFTTESIKLWISSIIQTEHETKLILGKKEEGGLKIVLKPKINRPEIPDCVDDNLPSMNDLFTDEAL